MKKLIGRFLILGVLVIAIIATTPTLNANTSASECIPPNPCANWRNNCMISEDRCMKNCKGLPYSEFQACYDRCETRFWECWNQCSC